MTLESDLDLERASKYQGVLVQRLTSIHIVFNGSRNLLFELSATQASVNRRTEIRTDGEVDKGKSICPAPWPYHVMTSSLLTHKSNATSEQIKVVFCVPRPRSVAVLPKPGGVLARRAQHPAVHVPRRPEPHQTGAYTRRLLLTSRRRHRLLSMCKHRSKRVLWFEEGSEQLDLCYSVHRMESFCKQMISNFVLCQVPSKHGKL